jgi:beta-N-acetylhexosaminidase
LRATELVPFAAACRASLATMMTAHVVYDALDPETPATLSSKIVTTLLRDELGFEGVVFSDDLEMRALADRMAVEESAIRAIRAGCDSLLVCESWELAERALEAMIRECERSAEFRARVGEANARMHALRAGVRAAKAPSQPDAVRALEAEISQIPH